MPNNLIIARLKNLTRDVNEELVSYAEAEEGITGSRDFDEGYVEGLRQFHLQLIEILQELE